MKEQGVGLDTAMLITFDKKRRPLITPGAGDHPLKALMSDSYLKGYQLGRGSQMIAAAKLYFPMHSKVGQRHCPQPVLVCRAAASGAAWDIAWETSSLVTG